MKLLIVSDMFSLESWLIDGNEPQIMPAVYEFFNYLGNSKDHSFDAIMVHPTTDKLVTFPNGSRIIISRLNTPFHYLRKFVSLSTLTNKAQELIAENEYDIVYGMTIYANVARKLGLKYNIPSVGRLFGSLAWDTIQKKQWIKLYTRFILQVQEVKNPCDLIISTEDGTEVDKAMEYFSPGAKYHLLYNGMNERLRNELLSLPAINTIDRSKEIRLVYIARLTQWKRQDIAINLVEKLVKKYQLKVTMDLYGKGETASYLRKLITSKGLENNVYLKGSINHADMARTIARYHAAVHFYDASNLGNAMWETAIGGRLIITRNTGKTSQLFDENNAIVMEGEDVDSLAEQFCQLLDKPFDLSNNSRALINQTLPSWPDRIENEMELIQAEFGLTS